MNEGYLDGCDYYYYYFSSDVYLKCVCCVCVYITAPWLCTHYLSPGQ